MDVEKNDIEKQLLSIAHRFLSELEAERAVQAISLDASLDHELGIDSLGKVELLHRIENTFSIHLPEKTLADVKSLRDLVPLIEKIASESPIKIKPVYSPILESVSLNFSSTTFLIDALKSYASKQPNRPHIYLQDEQGHEQIIRYAELLDGAKTVARGLHQRGIKSGETIAIMLPTTDEFFYAFLGILLVGAIPVPIYPPFRADQIEEYAKREAKILKNAQVRILITFARVKILGDMLKPFVPSLIEVTTLDSLRVKTGSVPEISIKPHDIALIQYTSGSTGDPKGVVLTHENMLSNMHAIRKSVDIQPTDVNVSWLPLYHDMGLMCWLASMYFGIPLTIMSPLIFLSRPERWLWAIHYHRATISGAPNFAYELCVKEINLKDIQGLDLSSLRFTFCGAETINPKTIHAFIEKFKPFGFKPDSFAPAYGLAESTVALTIPTKKRYPLIDKIQREKFEKENRAIPSATSNEREYLEFVACGEIISEHSLRIVDDAGNILNDRMVGNIQFSGPSAMQGYFDNPAATEKAKDNYYWNTGDLGYMADNELFVTGRKKDLIIKAGRNIYPEEIEEIVNQIAGIQSGGVIAFGVSDQRTGTEKLVIVAETFQTQKTKREKMHAEIIKQMSLTLDIPPDVIIFVAPHTIPKTASGKLQRSECKKNYAEGKIKHRQLPAKVQLIKLGLKSISQKMENVIKTLLKFIYAIYVGIILLVTTLPVLVILFLSPQKIAAKICRFWARSVFRLIFCPIKIKGQQLLQHNYAVIYVANHASYADALLILGLLPPGVVLTGKKELMQFPLINIFIKKLKIITVDRMDFEKSLEDRKLIEAAINNGKSVLIFPEGTITYATGLRPFKLGAFHLSTETQTPICPIAINGTRKILRDGSYFPTPGKINVTIGELIFPKKNDWDEVVRLHASVRSEIAKNCGESVIDLIGAEPAVE